VLWGIRGCLRCVLVSEMARIELRSGRVSGPASYPAALFCVPRNPFVEELNPNVCSVLTSYLYSGSSGLLGMLRRNGTSGSFPMFMRAIGVVRGVYPLPEPGDYNTSRQFMGCYLTKSRVLYRIEVFRPV
jgi:hypothetical protein